MDACEWKLRTVPIDNWKTRGGEVEAQTDPKTRSERILIVGDGNPHASEMTVVLQEAGYEVDTGREPEECLALLAREEHDLILCDVCLSEDIGLGLCRRLRSDPSGRDLPLVIVTRHNEPLDVLRSLEAEAEGVVSDSQSPDEILRRVRRVLERSAQRPERERRKPTKVHFRGTDFNFTAGTEELLEILMSAFEEVTQLNALLRDELEQRQQAERALGESGEQLRRAVLEAPFPVIIHAEDGEVILQSKVCAELTGYQPEEIPTIADWTEKVYVARRDLVEADIDLLYTVDARVNEGEYEIQTKSGTTATWDFSTAPLGTLPDGRRLVITMAMDVTARKRAERALQQQTVELARSNEELQQFAYVASHDLKEPLRVISSYVQLLQRRYVGKLDERADRYINYAADGAQRMKGLIDDLLAYSRMRTRRNTLEPVNCLAVLERAVANLDAAVLESNAEITHGDLPDIRGDESQMVQLFQNILGNAIKYRGEALPQIHVEGEKTEGGWKLAFRDNGIGIAPEHVTRIFEIFERLHSREEYSGTGIGLAVCKRIVERHGGRIWAESEVGKGSTFYFTLQDAEESKP